MVLCVLCIVIILQYSGYDEHCGCFFLSEHKKSVNSVAKTKLRWQRTEK